MGNRLLLIINPHAGRAAIKMHTLAIIDTFVKSGFDVTCYTTQKTGDPTRLIQECGDRFDRIVCCGGDGTINEGLNGLMTLKRRPPLGIIPVGVTNDYAFSLSIPSNALKAAKVAAGNRLFPIDVGSHNDRYFTYVSAFGLFTDVTYQTSQDTKNAIGGLAYVLEGAKRVSAIQSYRTCITYDDGIVEDDYILGLFSNSISVAGVRTLYTDALLDDGVLEIALIKRPTSFADTQEIINVLLNIKQASAVESDFLTILHTKKAIVESDIPVAWTVDGESAGLHIKSEIMAHHRAITVLTGRDMHGNSIASGDIAAERAGKEKLL